MARALLRRAGLALLLFFATYTRGDDAPNLYTIGELTAPVRPDALSSTGVVTDFSIMSVVMQSSETAANDPVNQDLVVQQIIAPPSVAYTFQLPVLDENGFPIKYQGTITSNEPADRDGWYVVMGEIHTDQPWVGSPPYFSLELNPDVGIVQGFLVVNDRFFSFETNTVDKVILITEIPLSHGFCIGLQRGADEVVVPPEPEEGTRRLLRGEKQLAPSPLQRGDEQEELENGAKPQQHEHADGSHHHHGHDHGHDHRQLPPGPGNSLLIYLDTNPPTGAVPGWATVTQVTPCQDPSLLTPAYLQTIMDLLREDFAPFNVRVSTDPNDWATWPNNRVRAAIMQNATVSNTVDVTCGRAIIGDFSRVAGATAWVSCNCFPDVISHEVGHTLGLTHTGDSSVPPASAVRREYLSGVPSTWNESANYNPAFPNNRRWNSIMGISGNFGLTTWTKGDYPNPLQNNNAATPMEEELGIMRTAVGQRPGTVFASITSCNQNFDASPPRTYTTGDAFTYTPAVITCGGGIHTYLVRFVTSGPFIIQVAQPFVEGDMRYNLTIEQGALDAGGNFQPVLTGPIDFRTSDGYTSAGTEITGTIPVAGVYRIVVQSVGQTENNAAQGASFNVYASVGMYVLTVLPPPTLACFPRPLNRRGYGCNALNDDCANGIDDCAEDTFPPIMYLADASCSDRTFLSEAALVTCVNRAVRAEDDCQVLGTPTFSTRSGPNDRVILTYTLNTVTCPLTTAVAQDFGPFSICTPVTTYRVGYGCNRLDENCDGVIDDCDEDRVGPTITLPTLERPPDLWFKTRDEVSLHFAQNTLAADDCSRDVTLRPLRNFTDACAQSSAILEAVDNTCNKSTVLTVYFPLDPTAPAVTVTIATTTLTSALTYHAPVVNVGLTVKATDSCVANGSLPVTIKLWSNQALRTGGTDGQGQLLRQQTATGQVTGWDLVLEPYSFWWCDGVKFLCGKTDRIYTVEVCATNLAGTIVCKSATVTVPPKNNLKVAVAKLLGTGNNDRLFLVGQDSATI